MASLVITDDRGDTQPGHGSGPPRAAPSDVWCDDAIAQKAIARNREAHPLAVPVAVTPHGRDEVAVCFLGTDHSPSKVMSAHRPLRRSLWPDGYTAPHGGPGHLTTFNATISANERPERILAAEAYLERTGIDQSCDRDTLARRGRLATPEELLRVHTAEHVEKMMSCLRCSPCHILNVATSFNTIFMNEYSVDAALYAAGLTIEATRAVMESASASSVCLVRPPGHHSECGRAMGFGIFNSVAVAAADALAGGGSDGGANAAERVLIVDWDIHHGNGTQEIFANDRRVLYFSAHSLYAFPAYASGELDISLQSPDYTGGEEAKGYSVNCAWGSGTNSFAEGYGDREYLHMMDELLMPIARSFDPSLVIVSAGFDSGAGDEMNFTVTPSGYARMIRRLKQLAGGNVVVVLEGGYNIPAVSRGLHACVAELLGVCEVGEEPEGEAESAAPSALADIQMAMEAQKPFWPCLRRE
eukprot:g1067.t1